MSNEVSLLGSVLYKCLVFPESFPTDLLDHFLSRFGDGLQVLGRFVTVRIVVLLIFESLDHYMSFFLAPAMA